MTTNDKIIKRNVQTTVGATEDLQVAIELHLGLPPDGASITVYMTEEQAWEHRASVYEALKDIKDERRRRGGHGTYETPIATLDGPALVRAQDYATESDLRLRISDLETEVAKLSRRDRSALLRMAGNVAAGILSAPLGVITIDGQPGTLTPETVARGAVAIARAILVEVDRG